MVIKYSYCQGIPTYVLVNIKYFTDLENEIYTSFHSRSNVDTPKDTIILWISDVLVLPAKYSCS